MRAAHTAYTAHQFMQVLQAVLYAREDVTEEIITFGTTTTPGDTLHVTLRSGQQFSLICHTLLDGAVIEPGEAVLNVDLPDDPPKPKRKRAPRKRPNPTKENGK